MPKWHDKALSWLNGTAESSRTGDFTVRALISPRFSSSLQGCPIVKRSVRKAGKNEMKGMGF